MRDDDRNSSVGAFASVLTVLGGVVGVNLAPDVANWIATGALLVVGCMPSIKNLFKR